MIIDGMATLSLRSLRAEQMKRSGFTVKGGGFLDFDPKIKKKASNDKTSDISSLSYLSSQLRIYLWIACVH